MHKLLIINPGSTSTKIGVYEDETQILEENLKHSADEIAKYDTIYDQFKFRKEVILNYLKGKNIDVKTFSAVVGRGGIIKPIESGTYTVNDAILKDSKNGVQGQHASNLGAIISDAIAKEIGVSAFIVDPVTVDEMQEVAKISGMPDVKRRSIFHALNQKAVAKRYAKEKGVKYEDLNLIVAHMGGGTSVGAHCMGKVIDVNNALTGEGPFSPERSGGVPLGDLIDLAYSGKVTHEEMKKKINGKGGAVAYAGTNDFKVVADKADAGDKDSKLIYDAYIYQIAKEIGQDAAVLSGKVDAVLLTGGISYNKGITGKIAARVSFIAPVVVFPGEDELLALAQGALRVLNGEEKAKIYK